jgi:hypothetical protein
MVPPAAQPWPGYFLGHCRSSSIGALVVTIIPVPAQFWQRISFPDGCFTDPLPSQIVQVCFVVINPSSVRLSLPRPRRSPIG